MNGPSLRRFAGVLFTSAALVSTSVSAAPDGGVYEVVSAELPDAGTLGPGWYLTDERIQSVGKHIVELENEAHRCKEPDVVSEQPAQPGFVIGLLVGLVGGAAAIIFGLRATK